jgi:hypothetical protein
MHLCGEKNGFGPPHKIGSSQGKIISCLQENRWHTLNKSIEVLNTRNNKWVKISQVKDW